MSSFPLNAHPKSYCIKEKRELSTKNRTDSPTVFLVDCCVVVVDVVAVDVCAEVVVVSLVIVAVLEAILLKTKQNFK